MSEPATPTRPFYVTGGTLKPGEPSYVERRADTELFESVLAGEFCYVLTARQMGKSSLMAKTAARLEQAGVRSAIVDLTQIGSERGAQAAAQWYYGIANEIHRRLGIAVQLRPWWQEQADLPPVQRLTGFFRELVLQRCPGRVVIFVDEIDSTIGLPFADDFFAALRACFNARATEPAFERLTFVLLGVATPDQLIRDPARTPFNIGRRIDLTDFRPDEAERLAPGLHVDPDEADRRLERVLHWTSGHPYLTQALCRAVRDRGETGPAEEAVDPLVEELFLTLRAQREETNLKHARARLEKPGPEGRRLLQLYRRVRQGKPVPDQPNSSLFAQLKLAGVVKATDEGRLVVRNRIYEAVFTPHWAKAAMPADRGRELAAATLAASLAGILFWYAVYQPRPYEQALQTAIADNGYNTALEAYTALRANPFSRSRANEFMQQFWEQRALKYALKGQRDESLLSYLEGLRVKDNERLRRQVQNLIDPNYARLQVTVRHTGIVRAVAFSPDGQTIATGAGDARLWDVRSGGYIAAPLPHRNAVVTVAFSPDGLTVATGSGDTTRLWDARSGRPIATPLQHPSSVVTVVFSPDGRNLATVSRDGTAQFWDVHSGKPIATPLQLPGLVTAAAFSPDGRTLAIGSGITAWLWDTSSGNPIGSPLKHRGTVDTVAFSPDGRTLATGSGNIAQLWEARSGKPLAHQFVHERAIVAMTFSPGGDTLATGSGNAAWLWDVSSGNSLSSHLKHPDLVAAVAFSRDGRTLATGSSDNTARLWDIRSRRPLASNLKVPVYDAAFSADGRTLAIGSEDGTARLWDVLSEKPLAPTFRYKAPIYTVTFSPDGRTLATGSKDGIARLWDTRSGKSLAPAFEHNAPIYAVAFSPDGRNLATGSLDKTARLWGILSGKLFAPPLEHQDFVVAVTFSPDGRTLATGSLDGTARFWSTRSGKSLAPTIQQKAPIFAMAFNPDGRTLAIGTTENVTQLWDTHSGRPLTEALQHQEWVRSVAFSPDGKLFFVATIDWLNTYSWDGKKAVPQGSQLLHGFWMWGFYWPSDCERCLQVVLSYPGSLFRIETLRLDEPIDPPIEGDPRELLEKWKTRLALEFDDQMRPVPQ